MNFTYAFCCLILGLVLITLIDTVGAIASRKFNFKYVYLSVLSFAVYLGIGYLLSKQYNAPFVFLVAGLLGLYDGTIGFWLSIVLRANNGLETNKSKELLNIKTAVSMILIAILFAFIGIQLAKL
jgi:CDP-diglyceride synthetase